MAGRLSDLLSATGASNGASSSSATARTIVIPHDDIVWIEAEDYCARW